MRKRSLMLLRELLELLRVHLLQRGRLHLLLIQQELELGLEILCVCGSELIQ